MRTYRAPLAVALSLTVAMVVAGLDRTSSYAAQPSDPGSPRAMVNVVPSTKTPAVDNGDVRAIAKVGTTMVIGGNFTSVNGHVRNHVAAFTASTGVLSTSFAPSINGPVFAVIPGPTAHTVFVGGDFSQIGGTPVIDLALLNVNTGKVVSSFHTPVFSPSRINDLVLRANRLYVAGTFVKAGGKTHKGLASLNATTGAVDPFMNVQLTGHHNDSGSGAQGPVGPWAIDVTADGSVMVAIGNFKFADGVSHDQVVLINLAGSRAAVRNSWSTSRYAPYCTNTSFDSYVRGVSFSPNGSFFVVATSGGPNPGTLCDAVARWKTKTTGTDIQPTWINETGGDTLWATTVTKSAIFVGGHQRWSNNPGGSDDAKPGAVPRPGLQALDPASGRPLKWNPGRNPPGKAVYAMLSTSRGLYIGSNTDWIGNRQYKRPKLALFTYAGGVPLASTVTGHLPGKVYLAGSLASAGGADDIERISFSGSSTGSRHHVPNGGIPWSHARGAFMVGNKVFYGWTDGFLHSRTYNGTTFGADKKIDPYHDPVWAHVDNHLGGTFDGATPTLYDQLPNVTGMFYSVGRLYYTLAGSSRLRWRWFSPDSGIVDERTNIVSSSISFSHANGMFRKGSTLYYASSKNGALRKVAFSGVAVTGSPTKVSGPAIDGVNWRNRAMFLYSG